MKTPQVNNFMSIGSVAIEDDVDELNANYHNESAWAATQTTLKTALISTNANPHFDSQEKE